MLMLLVLWASSFMIVLVSSQKAGPQVVTSRGLVVGLNMDHTNTSGAMFKAYLGIPYGEQPLRFQLPQQKSPWSGPLYAQQHGLPCPQRSGVFSEDCLKLNVFTPQNSTPEAKLPVLVYIHGAAFNRGSSKKYGPDFLVAQDIVVVTFNFRMGAVGYLTFGSPTAPGNLGLHDSLLALRWVQQEITAFGGDPSRVTLMGHSTGSVMANFIIISPLSYKDVPLFSRAITLAGAALSECYQPSLAEAVKRSHQLARALNCDFPTNHTATLTCLQAASVQYIVGNQSMITKTPEEITRFYKYSFRPMVDDYTVSDTPFFNGSLENLTKETARRNIPIMTGFSTDEGITAFDKYHYWKLAENHLEWFIPLSVANKLSEKERQHAVDKIRSHYFPNSPDLNKIASLVNLFGDARMKFGMIKTARLYKNTTYAFIYNYDGSWRRIPSVYFSQFNLKGINHGDELPYIWYYTGDNQYLDKCKGNLDNIKVKNIMVQLLTNFVKTGTPSNGSVPWEVLAKSNQYLVIDSELSTVNASEVERKHFNLWADIEAMVLSSSTNPILFTSSFMLLMICVIQLLYYFIN